MREKAILHNPQRIYGPQLEEMFIRELGEAYRRYRVEWEKVSLRETVTDFPLYIQIEQSGKCNLRCPSCPQGIEELRDEFADHFQPMEIGLYQKIISEASANKCPSISFHNNDEPLLLRDIEDRIHMAKEAGFLDRILTTNATLLIPRRAEKLLQAGLTKINFSVDACRPEDYEKVRIGGNFEVVVRNIDHFYRLREKMGLRLPAIRITCVLSKHTASRREEFAEFWGARSDVIEFQNFQAILGHNEHLRPPNSVVDTDFSCNLPWQQVLIRANGDVLPCCSFYASVRGLVVGNVRDATIREIWQGEHLSRLRKSIGNDDYECHVACSQCSRSSYVPDNASNETEVLV